VTTEQGWVPYESNRPADKGVYQWRVPSVTVSGLVITFYAHMRRRGAGYVDVISPAFDYWDGYRVLTPKGLEWRTVDNPPAIRECDYTDLQPEGVSISPCPFCGKVPAWKALEGGSSGGVVINGDPHRYNRWWLECCGWAGTPRFDDPRTLAAKRQALLERTAGAKEVSP
jgi:hypothetical protein